MTDENHELPDILGEDLGYLLGWVALGETLGDDDGEEAARAMGEAIVGCEEMQAIKQTLFDLTHPTKWKTADGPRALHVENLRTYGLPQTVIDWVLS